MSKYDGALIEVINWDKYNPRSDSKRPTWFRVDYDLALGPAFFDLDAEQKWLWIVILSLVCQKNGEPIVWNSGYIESNTKIKAKKQDDTIEIFEKFVRLRVSRTNSHVGNEVPAANSHATNVRTNERTTYAGERIFELWNQHRGQLSQAKEFNANRRKHAKARWEECSDEEVWIDAIKILAASNFCNGDNDRKWKADFDFLLKPDTRVRALEGKYGVAKLTKRVVKATDEMPGNFD